MSNQDESKLPKAYYVCVAVILLSILIMVVWFTSLPPRSQYECTGKFQGFFSWNPPSITPSNIYAVTSEGRVLLGTVTNGEYMAAHNQCVLLSGANGKEPYIGLYGTGNPYDSDTIDLTGFGVKLGLPMYVEIYW